MALNFNEKNDLFQLRLKSKIDSRMTACRVTATRGTGGVVILSGFSHYAQTNTFIHTVAEEVFGKGSIKSQLHILERLKLRFAVVTDAFAPIWRNPDDTDPQQLDTQALYGTILRTYHTDGEFTFVQHSDGYVGYLPTQHLAPVTIAEYLRWKNGSHVITLNPLGAGEITVPPGARLVKENGRVVLPDGNTAKVAAKDVVTFDPSHSSFINSMQKRAEQFMDSPYLWGGKTEAGIDCSGFVQTLALQEGIFLPRDASMQCHVGEIVGYLPKFADLLPGDIMFFMNKNAFVFHVGIYLGNHKYMHSAGKTGPTVSSVFPKGENYMGRYGTNFVYARRIHR